MNASLSHEFASQMSIDGGASHALAVIVLPLIGLVLVAAGVLMVWLARKSLRDDLARNEVAGVRTRLTLSSDAAWYPAQRAAARRTAIGGSGAIVAGVLMPFALLLRLQFDPTMVVAACVVVVGAAWMIGWALAGTSAAQRAAREATAA